MVAGFADQAFGFFEMRAGLGAVAAGEGATGRGEVAVGEVESRAAMRKTPAGREACRISRERKGNSKSARFGGRMHHLAGRLPIGGRMPSRAPQAGGELLIGPQAYPHMSLRRALLLLRLWQTGNNWTSEGR